MVPGDVAPRFLVVVVLMVVVVVVTVMLVMLVMVVVMVVVVPGDVAPRLLKARRQATSPKGGKQRAIFIDFIDGYKKVQT